MIVHALTLPRAADDVRFKSGRAFYQGAEDAAPLLHGFAEHLAYIADIICFGPCSEDRVYTVHKIWRPTAFVHSINKRVWFKYVWYLEVSSGKNHCYIIDDFMSEEELCLEMFKYPLQQ